MHQRLRFSDQPRRYLRFRGGVAESDDEPCEVISKALRYGSRVVGACRRDRHKGEYVVAKPQFSDVVDTVLLIVIDISQSRPAVATNRHPLCNSVAIEQVEGLLLVGGNPITLSILILPPEFLDVSDNPVTVIIAGKPSFFIGPGCPHELHRVEHAS